VKVAIPYAIIDIKEIPFQYDEDVEALAQPTILAELLVDRSVRGSNNVEVREPPYWCSGGLRREV
jgi:hypothetical protein